jgi:hypothetical protein
VQICKPVNDGIACLQLLWRRVEELGRWIGTPQVIEHIIPLLHWRTCLSAVYLN